MINSHRFYRARNQLNIENGQEFNWLGSWKIGFTINDLTHWLRTKLDYHPKWTTEGNFNDESPVLIAYLMIQLAALKETPTEEAWICDSAKSPNSDWRASRCTLC